MKNFFTSVMAALFMAAPVGLSLLTSDFLRDKVIGVLPEDISPVVKPILEQMPDVLKETTKLEIQLSLKK